MTRVPTEAELLAYVDGHLADSERPAVAAWLADNPQKSAEIEDWRSQNEAIRTLFGATAGEPVPARLNVRTLAARTTRTRHQAYRLAAAAMVLLALGAGAGWFGRDLFTPNPAASDQLIASAVTAHDLYVRENRHAVEVAAADRDHLIGWLSNRVGQPIAAPDLTPQGFSLVGGRLLPAGSSPQSGPAAQLMYENSTADRLTVFITGTPPPGADAYEFAQRDGLDAFFWATDDFTCTVVGSLPQAQMKDIARRIYQEMTRRPDRPVRS